MAAQTRLFGVSGVAIETNDDPQIESCQHDVNVYSRVMLTLSGGPLRGRKSSIT